MAKIINFRRPQITILEETSSTSGKYLLFYGVHYEKGISCWVVGTSNKATGEITMRHYNDKIPGCVAPKAQSRTYWEEFRNKMTERKPHGSYEEDDASDELKRLLTN